jgi:hypothetical protein
MGLPPLKPTGKTNVFNNRDLLAFNIIHGCLKPNVLPLQLAFPEI